MTEKLRQANKFNPWLVAVIVVTGNALMAYVVLSDALDMDPTVPVQTDQFDAN